MLIGKSSWLNGLALLVVASAALLFGQAAAIGYAVSSVDQEVTLSAPSTTGGEPEKEAGQLEILGTPIEVARSSTALESPLLATGTVAVAEDQPDVILSPLWIASFVAVAGLTCIGFGVFLRKSKRLEQDGL